MNETTTATLHPEHDTHQNSFPHDKFPLRFKSKTPYTRQTNLNLMVETLKKPLLIFIILLLVSMVSMVGVSPVYGQVYTTLYVGPPSIIDTTKTAGTTFIVNINVKNVTDLISYDLMLNYTTAVLTATNITLGPFFPSNSWVLYEEINDDVGSVLYSVAMPLGSEVGVTGSGTLATINFTVDSIGETALDLCNTKLWKVIEHWTEKIPHKVYDGYFSNILRPSKLHIDPENTIKPDLVKGENFTINVNMLNATDLFGYDFFLNYTTAVLTATNITLGPFFPRDSQIVHEEINDTLGYARYNVTMPQGAPSGKSGSGTLATINFTVDSIGETLLDLCNTKLVDSEGELIEHDTLDGYFRNKPIIHDIAITDVATTITTLRVIENISILEPINVTEVHVGEKVNITLVVENRGTVPETFNVTAYYDNETISTKNVTDLTDGFSITLTFEWSTEGVALGSYTIWAEASVVTGEDNTLNNKFIMEDKFKVSASEQPFPIEIAVAATIVVAIVALAVYFIKIRKPKPA